MRTLIIEDFNKVFADYDLILGPTAPTVAFGFGEKSEDPVRNVSLQTILTIPVNLAGITRNFDSGWVMYEGLPVGMQLIGKSLSDEETIYQVSSMRLKQATDHHKKRPPIIYRRRGKVR